MRILLVQPAIGIDVPLYLGLAQISAALRIAGHETALLKISRSVGQQRLLRAVKEYAPHIVGFTCVTHHWPHVVEWAAWIKKHAPHSPIIIGGPHATIDFESVMACPHIDAIVVSEGELAVVRLTEAYELKKDLTGIPGTMVRSKENGEWVKGGVAPFCKDLDSLPFPDHTIYGSRQRGDLYVMAGRGCPFECAYCCNHIFKKAQTGSYVRMRSADHILEELRGHQKCRKINRVVFADDTFTLNKTWLKGFLSRYRDTIGLPFLANAHIKHFDREVALWLKDAGCEQLQFGIESGSEKIRREILRRHMTNEDIIASVKTAKDAGLNVFALYMIGVPTETAEMARETLALHKQLGVEVAMITVFYPYPYTHLWNMCKELNLLSDGNKDGYQDDSSTLCKINMSSAELSSIYNEFESLRMQGSFSDMYIGANYTWARVPISILSHMFGKKRIIRWAMQARARMIPSLALHRSTYACVDSRHV